MKIDVLFDLMNSRNPFAKGTKQLVIKEYLPLRGTCYDELARYIFELKDEKGGYLWRGLRKTTIWWVVYSIHSIKAITEELPGHSCRRYKFALTNFHKTILSSCSIRFIIVVVRTTTQMSLNSNLHCIGGSLETALIHQILETEPILQMLWSDLKLYRILAIKQLMT